LPVFKLADRAIVEVVQHLMRMEAVEAVIHLAYGAQAAMSDMFTVIARMGPCPARSASLRE